MESSVRCWIRNLEHMREDTKNISIIGVIIGRSEPKVFQSAEKDARGVFTLTLRDSPKDSVNCVFWGSKEFILTTAETFKYGQVVSVIEAKLSISERSVFHPSTSSRFLLTVNEGKGRISHYTGAQESFQRLLREPLKPVGLTLSLSDVNSRGELATGDLVDLLVIVRMIRPLREVKTRFGMTHCREIVVMDRTFPGMHLIFWGKNCDDRINMWKPLETCLLLYDVKSDFSSFYRAVSLTFCPRTLIAEDVQVPEVKNLIGYAANVPPIERFSFECQDFPSPEDIRTVMSVQQVLDRAEGHLMVNEEHFTALIYAVVTKFDLDGSSRIVTQRCAFCKKIIIGDCPEAECVNLQFQGTQLNPVTFEISMDLTDHTGTLSNCRLTQDAAQNVLGMSAGQFLELSTDQRTNIKWLTLLERRAVKIVVRKRSVYRPRMWIGIVECRQVDDDEIARNIKVY